MQSCFLNLVCANIVKEEVLKYYKKNLKIHSSTFVQIIKYSAVLSILHFIATPFAEFTSPSCTSQSLQECINMTDKGEGELSKQRRESLNCSL